METKTAVTAVLFVGKLPSYADVGRDSCADSTGCIFKPPRSNWYTFAVLGPIHGDTVIAWAMTVNSLLVSPFLVFGPPGKLGGPVF